MVIARCSFEASPVKLAQLQSQRKGLWLKTLWMN